MDESLTDALRALEATPEDGALRKHLWAVALRLGDEAIALIRERCLFDPLSVLKDRLTVARLSFHAEGRDYYSHAELGREPPEPRERWLWRPYDYSRYQKGPRRKIGREKAITIAVLPDHLLGHYEEMAREAHLFQRRRSEEVAYFHPCAPCVAWLLRVAIDEGGRRDPFRNVSVPDRLRPLPRSVGDLRAAL